MRRQSLAPQILKLDEVKKLITKGRNIPEKKWANTRGDEFTLRFAQEWDELGLNLSEIIGIKPEEVLEEDK